MRYRSKTRVNLESGENYQQTIYLYSLSIYHLFSFSHFHPKFLPSLSHFHTFHHITSNTHPSVSILHLFTLLLSSIPHPRSYRSSYLNSITAHTSSFTSPYLSTPLIFHPRPPHLQSSPIGLSTLSPFTPSLSTLKTHHF